VPNVPPSTFLASSTVYSSSQAASLFHPAATCGIHSSGVFPAAKPYRLIDGRSLHDVLQCSPGPSCPDLPDPTASSSRCWSQQRSVATDRGFSPVDARSPLKFSLPRAFLCTPRRRLHAFSTHDLSRSLLAVTRPLAFSVFRCAACFSIPR